MILEALLKMVHPDSYGKEIIIRINREDYVTDEISISEDKIIIDLGDNW